MPYAVTKAAQLQLVKCLAVTVGPKIRVNTVLPGLLLTEWVSFSRSLLKTLVCIIHTPMPSLSLFLLLPSPSSIFYSLLLSKYVFCIVAVH